jgi:hypothetical protein
MRARLMAGSFRGDKIFSAGVRQSIDFRGLKCMKFLAAKNNHQCSGVLEYQRPLPHRRVHFSVSMLPRLLAIFLSTKSRKPGIQEKNRNRGEIILVYESGIKKPGR